MPKSVAKPSRAKKAVVAPRTARPGRDPKGVLERRRIAATLDVAAFHAATKRTAAATADEWEKPL